MEASGKFTEGVITIKEYVQMTLNDATNPNTAKVIYKMSYSDSSRGSYSATYEGNFKQKAND